MLIIIKQFNFQIAKEETLINICEIGMVNGILFYVNKSDYRIFIFWKRVPREESAVRI